MAKSVGKNYWNWDEHLHILRILSCHVKMMPSIANCVTIELSERICGF